jgi:hypothetical protein
MTIQKNNSNINETFIIEGQVNISGDCVAIYANVIEPCVGSDILLDGNLILNNLSATTYYGDGSNLTGINKYVSISGDTMTGNLILPSISATTYQNLPIDVTITGGTYSNGISTYSNNIGGTFNITGFTLPFTGGTISGNLVTPSVSATTISATTYYGDGSHLSNIDLSNRYVNITGDTMTGNLTTISLSATNITDLTLSGSTIRVVKVDLDGTLISSNDKQLISNITGTSIIDSVDSTTGDAIIWDYVLKSNTGMRAGTITGTWSGNTSEYYEIATNDIGNTQGVNLSVNILSGHVRLNINVTGNTWSIKTNRTLL